MRILVTGGSGFIGGRIVELLEADNQKVEILDRNKPLFQTYAEFTKGDVTRCIPRMAENINSFGEPYDVVFHCAALLGAETTFKRIISTEKVNVLGTLSVLDMQRNYGMVIRPSLLGDWLNPYMISTKTAERYGLMYREYFHTRFLSVRFTSIYGPHQINGIAQKKVVPMFVANALEGKPLPIYGNGSYKVRLLYVKDAARFLVKAAERYDELPPCFTYTSLWAENYITVLELANRIIELTGSSSRVKYLPMRIGQPLSAVDAEANMSQSCDVHNIVGIETEVPLSEGLRNTIEWVERCLLSEDCVPHA